MRINFFILTFCFLISSCTQTSMPEAGSTNSNEEKENTTKQESIPAIPAALSKESLEGNWFLSMYSGTTKLPVALVEIKKTEGDEYKASVLEIHPQFPPSKPESATIKGNQVNITLDAGDAKYVFDGKLTEAGFKGSAIFAVENGNCYPALMVTTELESFEGIRSASVDNRDLYVTATTSADPVNNLQQLIDDHPGDPLTLHAALKQIEIAKKHKLDQKTVEKLVRSYIKNADEWGNNFGIHARFNSIFALLNSGNLPQLSLTLAKEIESSMNDQSRLLWGSKIGKVISAAENALTLDTAIHGTGEAQEQAIVKLKEIRKKDPFDPELLSTLALYEKNKGNIEEAIVNYAMIIAFPQMEEMYNGMQSNSSASQPSAMEALSELWKKTHNDSTDGLEEYINQVYHDHISGFVNETYPARTPNEGKRRILLELFTGASCAPCAAADVALAGIHKKYADTEVVQLTYHQHIPALDPMANSDTEARFPYYPSRGTPTVLLNGKQLSGVAASMYSSVPIYNSMQNLFDKEFNDNKGITINLKANASDGSLNISAEVKGLKEIPESYKLRLAIAETEIDLPARNGIREHHMTVRGMPGGVEGISAKDGTLKYSESISLGKFKQNIENHLRNYAAGLGTTITGVPLEFKDLKLVAFVQDDKTRDVLQVRSIPVQGELVFKPVPEEKEPAPENPQKTEAEESEKTE